MRVRKSVFAVCITVTVLLLFQGTGVLSVSAGDYRWERAGSASFTALGIGQIGPLEYNGTHLLTFDITTHELLVIDLELTAVLENHSIVYCVNDSSSGYWQCEYPLIYGMTLAKGYLFASSMVDNSIYLLDPSNYSVIDVYRVPNFVGDLAYDNTRDCFVVTLSYNQTIAVYDASYFNGSLSSIEFGSLDTPSLVNSWFYPVEHPLNIATCDGEFIVFTLHGNYAQFSLTAEGLVFKNGEWDRIPFETYTCYAQDVVMLNHTTIYFTSPLANKITLFKGYLVEETAETGTTTTSGETNETSSTSSTTTNPLLYSSSGYGLLISAGTIFITAAITVINRYKNK